MANYQSTVIDQVRVVSAVLASVSELNRSTRRTIFQSLIGRNCEEMCIWGDDHNTIINEKKLVLEDSLLGLLIHHSDRPRFENLSEIYQRLDRIEAILQIPATHPRSPSTQLRSLATNGNNYAHDPNVQSPEQNSDISPRTETYSVGNDNADGKSWYQIWPIVLRLTRATIVDANIKAVESAALSSTAFGYTTPLTDMTIIKKDAHGRKTPMVGLSVVQVPDVVALNSLYPYRLTVIPRFNWIRKAKSAELLPKPYSICYLPTPPNPKLSAHDERKLPTFVGFYRAKV